MSAVLTPVGERDAFRSIPGLGAEILDAAATAARESGKSLGDVLVGMRHIDRADLCAAMSHAGQPVSVAKVDDLPTFTGTVLPHGESGEAVAIYDERDERRRFFVVASASATPAQVQSILPHAAKLGRSYAGRIIAEQSLLRILLGGAKQGAQQAEETSERADPVLHADFDKHARNALQKRASDIHITLRDGRGVVKFRIDGELVHYADWDADYTVAFCTAIYNTLVETGSTRTGFSQTERQDGAIERTFPEGLVRFRYASAPIAPNGFDITLRLIPLGVQSQHRTLAALGYSKDQCEDLDRMFGRSSGLIFFLGTTGSGKSTSMAVALEGVAKAKPGKKIRTVEQPVEYRIYGAYQTSVARDEFIPMISQMMRMDPDYMMVGEVRDNETAAAVLQGARSGHLCVTTLHADGAPLAYDRLQGLGVTRQDLSSVGLIAGIVYQKLVPLLCPHCRVSAEQFAAANPGEPILDRVRHVCGGELDGIYFARSGGCAACDNRGTKGRTVCAEILRPSVGMLSAIQAGNSKELWTQWRAAIDPARPEVMRGRTAFEHAIHKMRLGLLSPESVEREFMFLDEPPFGASA